LKIPKLKEFLVNLKRYKIDLVVKLKEMMRNVAG